MTAPNIPKSPRIILASRSKARQDMLRSAGVEFETMPADINEETLQQSGAEPAKVAQQLAEQKALLIAKQNPDALVIGSDQVLEFEGQLVSKPANPDDAITQLKAMAGKQHRLMSAVALAQGDSIVWTAQDSATLTMHALDDAFFEAYKARAGGALTRSVGGYWFEDIGSWLFEAIEGDYFTILGMPLLPLLKELRTQHSVEWAQGKWTM